ncbi:MAG: hypothetical protein PHT88_05185 [Candidatus Moranbacteria bacterium]|nr:hypothetical protein [Candidatus Moranbacteria bacterium]
METLHKKWLFGALSSVMFLCFFFGWLAVNQNITTPEANGWLFPILLFSLGISTLCIIAFVSKEKPIVIGGALLAFLPSLFFVQDAKFLPFLCVGIVLSIVGLFSMRRDMGLNMHISIRRSIHHGIGWLIFSFSLVIASLYYMQIQHASGEELLQKLSLDQTSHAVLTQALGLMNPEFRKVNQENVTVDEFLLNFQKDQSTGDEEVPAPSDEELLQMAGIMPSDPRAPQALTQIKKSLKDSTGSINTKRLVLEQGRRQLSGIVGVPLSGNEPIADILSQVIDQRIRTYFRPDVANGSASVLPFVLSVILFVTLWSLGAFLGILWRYLAAAIFLALCSFGAIRIQRVMVEQEVIE